MEDKFIIVNYNISRLKRISPLDKLVLGFVTGFLPGDAYASNETIASIMGVSSRSIQRSIKRLKDKKFISVQPVYQEGKQVGRIIWPLKQKKE